MPAVKGGGKWQLAILGTLDGQPRLIREVIQEVLGHPPSEAEYNAAHRAARLLVERGQLRGWQEPGQYHRLVLLKVTRWVRDGDGGTVTEQQQAVDPLQEFVDEAWRAFATDVGYAADIAQAACNLARVAHRDPGLLNPRDFDVAHGGEPGPRVGPWSRLDRWYTSEQGAELVKDRPRPPPRRGGPPLPATDDTERGALHAGTWLLFAMGAACAISCPGGSLLAAGAAAAVGGSSRRLPRGPALGTV